MEARSVSTKTAKENLDQAINQLASIPDGTFISSQVKTKLATYREQSIVIIQGMTAEEKAATALQVADTLAKQAMETTSSKYEFKLADLQNAQTMWLKAIAQLKKVPTQSEAFQRVDSQMSVYLGNSRKIANSIQEMQTCLSHNPISQDSCSLVSLSLDNPVEANLTSNSDHSDPPIENTSSDY